MANILQKDLENSSLIVNSDENAGLDLSGVLDLSCKHVTRSPEPTNVSKLSYISNFGSQNPSNKVDKHQLIQQLSINDVSFTPMNLHMEMDTTKLIENQKLSQEQTNNNGQINYYQINNVQINGQINNDQVDNSQINCNQMNVDQMLHNSLKNNQIDQKYINNNQAIAKDINSNTSYINNLFSSSIGQSILHNSIAIEKPINMQYLPTNNMSTPNTHLLQLPVTMAMQEIEQSTLLTSITKASRPFKVYPKDPLVLSAGNKDTSDAYHMFRKNVLRQVKHTEKEGTNNKMRRTSNSSPMNSIDNGEKNRAYLEKRRKNNAAAKRSRDARRAKEDEIAIRAAYLEQENNMLKNMLHIALSKMQEKNIQLDFRSLIELNGNIPSSSTVNSSS